MASPVVRHVNGAVAADFSDFGIADFPFKILFKKCFRIVGLPLWRRNPALELQIAAICGAVVRSSIVFCNSVFADRSGMAASRFLVAAAACVVLLRFAAESRKSHCNGNVRREWCFGSRFFSILAVMSFLFNSF